MRRGPHPHERTVGDGGGGAHPPWRARRRARSDQRRHLRRWHAVPHGPICAHYNVYYYPIVSSARAFRALWKRAYHKFGEWLGGVVYEDPWLAGGHNGLSNVEDPEKPEPPFPRVLELRALMREFGLAATPIFMAGGVWNLREWEDWIDNPELGPVAFQFGTRPLLTRESPISDAWKRRLLGLREGDVYLNRFSPTGFYSSAVRNLFLTICRPGRSGRFRFRSMPSATIWRPWRSAPAAASSMSRRTTASARSAGSRKASPRRCARPTRPWCS